MINIDENELKITTVLMKLTSCCVDTLYTGRIFPVRSLNVASIVLVQIQLFNDGLLGTHETHCKKNHITLVDFLGT